MTNAFTAEEYGSIVRTIMATSHLCIWKLTLTGSALLPADRIQHAHGDMIEHAGLILGLHPAAMRVGVTL